METGVQLPLGKGVRVLKVHPSGMIALEKPTGIMSTPNTSNDYKKSLLNAKFEKKKEAYVWMGPDQEKVYFYICHRLDSPTSGLLIGSTSATTAIAIKKAFQDKQVSKTYLAVVDGIPRKKNGVWKDSLSTQKASGGVRTRVGGPKGDMAETVWSVRASLPSKRFSLLEMQPISGKTHQLRVQTSHRGFPILGDRTYGDFKLNAQIAREHKIRRLMLHALEIELQFQADDKEIRVKVATQAPDSFVQLFDI
jgi:tRNA pseudouridine65 synthase